MKEQNLKYFLIAWIGCCLLLMGIFYIDIQHEKRRDKIWDEYEKEMKIFHSEMDSCYNMKNILL